MARKKRKSRQERGVDPTIKPIEEDSKEAIEAAKKHDEEQRAHMADLDDDLEQPTEPEATTADPAVEEKPSEKPAQTEPESPPEEAKEPEEEAKAEEQPPEGDQPDKEADVPDDSKLEDKPADEKPPEDTPKEPAFVSGDQFGNYNVEVVSDEGAKMVPLGNLVTTYQQFGHLQRKYGEVKPLFDLTEKAKVSIKDTLPLLELGIQTFLKQQGIVDGTQPAVAARQPATPAEPGSYQGPFKDEEQDAYYKEVDPDHHAAMHNMFNMIQGGGKVAHLEQEIENLKRSSTAAPASPAADPAAGDQAQEKAQKAFDDKILSWSGDHTDYFRAENIGEARLNAFKNFIIRNHAQSGLKIGELTPDFLAAEFARFDPRYNLEYMKKIAAQKAADGKNESGMFAEGSGMRTQAEPLDEQQKHMADM